MVQNMVAFTRLYGQNFIDPFALDDLIILVWLTNFILLQYMNFIYLQ